MNICVTGGAGYVGSFIVRRLCDDGHGVTVVDDLSKGHASAVDPRACFIRGNCGQAAWMAAVLADARVQAVVHMAASSVVSESVAKPDLYYRNNVINGLSVLEAMAQANVRRLVFSSTAAVYGLPRIAPIAEDHPTVPINPYGRTKLIFEQALSDLAAGPPASTGQAFGAVSLRYFNVAGALPDGSLGEDHRPETHLVPRILAAAAGRQEAITVFGDDYPTPDGTCVRDYIHVLDLADAHVRAIEAVEPGRLKIYNLGNGGGFSVRQVIQAAERVVGRAIPTRTGPRRPGDPPVLVASSEKIRRELGWRPAHADLDHILADAWAFHRKHPDGYRD